MFGFLVAALAVGSTRTSTALQPRPIKFSSFIDSHTSNNKVRRSSGRAKPLVFELVKSTIPSNDAMKVLQTLKLRQNREHWERIRGTSFLQADEVFLAKEVIKEKKLVTYFTNLQVGSQLFRVLLDTGSCEFWIPSSHCRSLRCSNHRQYDMELPNLKVFSGSKMNIEYISGKVAGPFLFETVKLGQVEVTNQLVGVAAQIDIPLLDTVKWDGILGLAFPTAHLVSEGLSPFFDTVMRQKVLTNQGLLNQFAYYIDDEGGSFTLGGANCDIFSEDQTPEGCADRFSFVPVSERTYWTLNLQDVRVKWPGKPELSGQCPADGCKAIIDTGTYLIYGPHETIHSTLMDTIASCDTHTDMPDLLFDIVGSDDELVTLKLRPVDYILKFRGRAKKVECVMGISPDHDQVWTLGQVFLRAFYTIFDRDVNQVGFAPLNRKRFPLIEEKQNYANDLDAYSS